MDILRKRGQQSNILRVYILRSTGSAGPLTGLTSTSVGLVISTIADDEPAPTVYTSAASNIETIPTLGTYSAPSTDKCRFREVDATNHPGLYEVQLDDARFGVVGSKHLWVTLSGAVSMETTNILVQLTSTDLDEESGPVLTAGSGVGQLNVEEGRGDVNVTHWVGTIVPGPTISGVPKVDVTLFKGAASAGAAGYAGIDWSAINAPASVQNLTGTKVLLAAAGLDSVIIESGITAGPLLVNDSSTQLTQINARQAFSICVSALGAVLSGAATPNVAIQAGGKPATTRISATVDPNGNRTQVGLRVPD